MGLQVHGFTLLFNFKYSFYAATQIDDYGTRFVNRREGLMVSVTKLGIQTELQKAWYATSLSFVETPNGISKIIV